MLGEAAFGLLRKDEPPIRNDVVLALRAFDRLRVVPLIGQLSRETRGSFVVAVSDGAVVDLHAPAPIITTPARAAAAGTNPARQCPPPAVGPAAPLAPRPRSPRGRDTGRPHGARARTPRGEARGCSTRRAGGGPRRRGFACAGEGGEERSVPPGQPKGGSAAL